MLPREIKRENSMIIPISPRSEYVSSEKKVICRLTPQTQTDERSSQHRLLRLPIGSILPLRPSFFDEIGWFPHPTLVHWTLGILRGLHAFFWLQVFSAPKQNPHPNQRHSPQG